MLKNILNLNGAKALNKNEQQSINGGCPTVSCPTFTQCLATCNGYGSYCFEGPMQTDGSVCYSCVTINIGER